MLYIIDINSNVGADHYRQKGCLKLFRITLIKSKVTCSNSQVVK